MVSMALARSELPSSSETASPTLVIQPDAAAPQAALQIAKPLQEPWFLFMREVFSPVIFREQHGNIGTPISSLLQVIDGVLYTNTIGINPEHTAICFAIMISF